MSRMDPLKLVFERNAFFRRQYLLTLGLFALSLVITAMLMSILLYVVYHPIKPLYFAVDNFGRLVNVTPVEKPNMSDEEVRQWVIEAVQSAYSYDYVNYRSQLQETQKYFSEYGWTRFMDALKKSNNLEALKRRQLVVVARVVDDPLIVTKGLLSGAYAWKFEMPLLITFWMPPYDQQSKFSNALKISVIVRRQPILQSNQGLGILQIVGSTATS